MGSAIHLFFNGRTLCFNHGTDLAAGAMVVIGCLMTLFRTLRFLQVAGTAVARVTEQSTGVDLYTCVPGPTHPSRVLVDYPLW